MPAEAPAHKLYVNVSSEQDLITLLGSLIVDELRALGLEPHALVMGEKEDPGLAALLEKRGIPLRHLPYRRSPGCRRLAGIIRKLRKIQYYGRSGRSSTLYAKSRMGYREGTFNLPKYWAMKAVSKVLAPLRLLHPLVVRAYHRRIEGLPDLDAPVVSLDYIHNDDHLELSHLSRRRGSPYITYVANLDQITNYDVHLDVADRILVWGDFHASVFTDRYGLPAERIAKVGFCRSDLIAGVSRPDDGALHAVYFCANTPANDPILEENLRHMLVALEAGGRPYTLTLKKHPVNEKGVWERYLAAVEGVSLAHGEVRLVGSTWEKYSKLEKGRLEDKDFSYKDLRDLFASASHVFSATSTTTLEAAIAGAPAYFVNLGHKLDGCFAFEHMRVLMASGMVRMVVEPAEFSRIFASRDTSHLPRNPLLENIGAASRAFAREVRDIIFPGTPLLYSSMAAGPVPGTEPAGIR